MIHRTEHDLLGAVQVPADALYGAQTQRAVENFPLYGARRIGDFPALINALMFIKQAGADVNAANGDLDASIAGAIVESASKVRREGLYAAFPIHYLHGGGGTSANMNANEVLANLAEEQLGGRRGEYRRVHPNDHVNRHQSTNDVYPAACHIAVILTWPALRAALDSLAVALERQAVLHAQQPRIARTCLQDAVAISFADLFGGYVQVIRRGTARVHAAVDALHAVPLGGTIVGRATDVSPAYLKAIVPRLAHVTGDPGYRQSANLFDAAQNLDDLAAVSGTLALLASSLLKIAQDFRLMNSGPETGFGEITLPPVQPGSSIMPGKINPVIPEFLIQACFKVVGNDLTCQSGVRHGELDLNVWESAVVFSVLESMPLLQSAVEVFTTRCVAGITVHAARNTANAQTLIPRLTELMKRHGYSTVSQVCHDAGQDLEKLKALLKERFGDE